MLSKYSLVAITLCLVGTGNLVSADIRAQEQCRNLHHTDVDDQGTAFLNQECQLNCAVHGKVTAHYLNEDGHCPNDKTGICRNGQCITQTGYIDVEVTSGSIAQQINAFVNVCIRNHSDPIEFPLKSGIDCFTCNTEIIASTAYANWNKICTTTSNVLFSDQSRVAFELADHHGPNDNYFVGGTSLTIPQLLSHGDSNKKLHLAVIGGHIAGQVNVRVTWTPKH